MAYTAGNLIRYRNRDWMVLPSPDQDILMVKPLGASDEETTGIYLPLAIGSEKIEPASFKEPTVEQIGNFETAKLLFNASRLALRNAAGPFRCMGKLSFNPRAYQIVPLVMALKQDVTRLLIADDVGVGKTIEALIIIKELMERGEIKRFAVICPPHLCEQWQKELKDKLDIEAEIIRSSTASKLDRTIADDRSVFYHIPYQIISIDYIKTDKRRGIFLNDCPEMVVFDEAHTCALPQGAKSKNQMLRHLVAAEVAKKEDRHLLLLTATPHSGKDEEFASLLGLIKPEFRTLDYGNLNQTQRRDLAKHFIQRKRGNVKRWMNEDTVFPERDAKEIGFPFSNDGLFFYNELLNFARLISQSSKDNENTKLIRSWAAIALIKGAMSSPQMAVEMLERRKLKLSGEIEENIDIIDEEAIQDTLFEEKDFGVDYVRSDLLDEIEYQKDEAKQLDSLLNMANHLKSNVKLDSKLQQTIKIVKDWLKEGFQPIVFCHYIPTAKYVAEALREALPNKVTIQAITSELGDEQRKEEVERMGKDEQRVLIATDCLSEGINLQDYFDAVLHYDLPWNPNRIEQREGRVNRFGQVSPITKAYMLYGENNPMDKFILEVLIKKVREIQKSIGVTIPIGESNKSLMAEITERILQSTDDGSQLQLFESDKIKINDALESAREKGESIRSIFAHESTDAETIKEELDEVHEAIGDIKTVEDFTLFAIQTLGANYSKAKKGFKVQTTNLPLHLQAVLSPEGKNEVKISFESPTPRGYQYIGRNHRFTEQLSNYVIATAFDDDNRHDSIGRTSVIQTDSVQQKTTLVMFRVRNVVKEVNRNNESVAEEMFLWGYTQVADGISQIDYKTAKKLLIESIPLSNLGQEHQAQVLTRELQSFEDKKDIFKTIAAERADKLVEAHGRFKSLIGGRAYEKSTPILPPDVMGVYVLLPQLKAL